MEQEQSYFFNLKTLTLTIIHGVKYIKHILFFFLRHTGFWITFFLAQYVVKK